MNNILDDLNVFKNWIKESKYTVIMTGAGMSTESGIPDFRSKDGLWRKMDPMEVASIQTLNRDYSTFYEFYKARSKKISGLKPHSGYEILAKWEEKGLIDSIITQNIDDFHISAGSKKVYRLHGSINEFKCNKCGKKAEKQEFLEKKTCSECGGNLRPDVVLFGEGLKQSDLYSAIEEVKKADLIVVIGTSLTVFPVNQLPDLTDGKKVYINKEIYKNSRFDLVFQENAGDLLEKIERIL